MLKSEWYLTQQRTLGSGVERIPALYKSHSNDIFAEFNLNSDKYGDNTWVAVSTWRRQLACWGTYIELRIMMMMMMVMMMMMMMRTWARWGRWMWRGGGRGRRGLRRRRWRPRTDVLAAAFQIISAKWIKRVTFPFLLIWLICLFWKPKCWEVHMFQIFQRNPLKRQQSVMRLLSAKSHTDFPWKIENTIYIANSLTVLLLI